MPFPVQLMRPSQRAATHLGYSLCSCDMCRGGGVFGGGPGHCRWGLDNGAAPRDVEDGQGPQVIRACHPAEVPPVLRPGAAPALTSTSTRAARDSGVSSGDAGTAACARMGPAEAEGEHAGPVRFVLGWHGPPIHRLVKSIPSHA